MSKFYPAMMHNVSRALREVRYPITKEELIGQVGKEEVRIDYDRVVTMEDLIDPVPLDQYSCAAELYNNIICVIW